MEIQTRVPVLETVSALAVLAGLFIASILFANVS